MMPYYKLDKDKNVVLVNRYPNMSDEERRVGLVISDDRKVSVSTVFLQIDHNLGYSHKGLLVFETLVFGGIYDGEMERYSTWNEALRGHYAMCKKVFKWTDKEYEKVIAEHFVEFL